VTSPGDSAAGGTPPAPSTPEALDAVDGKALTLVEQNRVFAQAIERHRAGDTPGAVELLEQLLRGAPRSPLAEPALAQQLRWLEPLDHARALETARRYLKQHPMGSARADAERIIGP
jgi:hypothetical protein